MARQVIKLLLTAPEGAASALETALAMSKARAMGLGILCLLPDPQAVAITAGDAMAASVLTDLVEMARQRNRESAEAVRGLAAAAAEAAGLEFVDSEIDAIAGPGQVAWCLAEGDVRSLAAEATRLADLVIAPSGEPDAVDGRGEAIEAALMGGGAPLLLVPEGKGYDGNGRVAVGWDGGLQSARALRQALPIMSEKAVTLITIADSPPKPSPEAAAAYLRHRGIGDVHTLVVPMDYREIGEALAAEAQAVDCELLVMGCYGHSRLREMILGGATRWVLAQAPLPVLLLH